MGLAQGQTLASRDFRKDNLDARKNFILSTTDEGSA